MARQGSITRTLERAKVSGVAVSITLGLILVTVVLLVRGMEFYGLDLEARVEHQDYEALRPSGLWGHGYGIVGTGLILTNLLYLVRRRFAGARVGSMKAWLDMHVFTGLAGSVLILFHSAFQLRTPIATTTAISLGVVVGTGAIGRYLVTLTPKPDAQKLAENIQILEGLIPGLAADVRKGIEKMPPTRLPPNAGLVRAILTLPRWFSESRARKRLVLAALEDTTRPRSLDPFDLKHTDRVARETASLVAGEVRTVAASSLLRSWRGLHRLLAILLILSVSVHIAVAWVYGYRWIFSEP